MRRCCFGITGPLVALRAGAAEVMAKAFYPGLLLFPHSCSGVFLISGCPVMSPDSHLSDLQEI